MSNLNGKTALVTGASRGIGRAAALALGQRGARVLVHYGRAEREAEAVADSIRATGGQAETIGADLEAADGPFRLAEAVRAKLGASLDILFANAGVSHPAPLADLGTADFDRLFAVNVRAPYFLLQQLLPVLGEGSRVIFTSSLAARAAVANLSAYAATKGAIDTLVKHLALELGPRGIRVNAVAPGVVETDMSGFARTESGRAYTFGMQALQHLAQPDDIAGAVVFLASDEGRWVNGATLHVDGGSKL